MLDYEQPAIQNSTQACFYCNSKLTDVTPPESWEVRSGERFIKVRCSNQQCGSVAWRPDQQKQEKKN
jgi:uncharacterized protein with PIN domain